MKIKTDKKHKLKPLKITYPNVSVIPSTRFRIMFLLRNKKFKINTVSALADTLGKSASNISEQLAQLKKEKIAVFKRVGKTKVWELVKKKKF